MKNFIRIQPLIKQVYEQYRDEGSYQLSHIYDGLFTTTSSGEQKLPDHSKEGSGSCQNVNRKLKVVFW